MEKSNVMTLHAYIINSYNYKTKLKLCKTAIKITHGIYEKKTT